MLISKTVLRKLIHEVTSIITFDCRDNYSDTSVRSKTPCEKWEVFKKPKMHVELKGLHLQQYLSQK